MPMKTRQKNRTQFVEIKCISELRYKKGRKWRENEEKDVGSCWVTLRKRDDNGNWKRKHQIAQYGELAWEKAANLSYGRLWNEWISLHCCECVWISVSTATNHKLHKTVLKKLKASSRNSHFMASKGSLSRSQQTRHCPHPQPNNSVHALPFCSS